MKKRSFSLKVPGLAMAMLMAGGPSLYAQYTWNRNSSSTYSWGADVNWKDEVAPPDVAEHQVRFDSYGGSSPVVELDKDRVLNAGIFFSASTTNSGQLSVDLKSHRLIINGSDMVFDPNSAASTTRTTVLFTDGTVQFGAENAANLVLGAASGNGYAGSSEAVLGVVFDGSTTFDSANLGSIRVAVGTASRLQNLELDLSQTVMTAGESMGGLKVNDSVTIGSSLTTRAAVGRHKFGALKLGVVSEVSIGGDLVVGYNARTNENETNARGALIFSEAAEQGAATLRVAGSVQLGVGAGAEGTLQTPVVLHTEIGSSSERGGFFQVGYKQTTAAAATGDASGSFVAQEGSFSAYVTEFRVGQNANSSGAASGVVDLRNVTLETLDISGEAVIGSGNDAVGEVWFSGGSARSTSLTVGTASGDGLEEARSMLNLDGTEWVLSSALTIGQRGDITVSVGEVGGGLTLLFDDENSFTIENGGLLRIFFESEEAVWGLRMAGDHEGLFNAFLASSQLLADGTYGSYAEVYQEGGYTYLGLQAIPEPSTYLFLGSCAATLLLYRTRRNGR